MEIDPGHTGELLKSATSLLFVPGDKPDRVGKALATSAAGVIVDLEDAVSPENRNAARASLKEYQAQSLLRPSPLFIVRTNPWGSPDFAADLAAVLAAGVSVVMVPKFVAGPSAQALDSYLKSAEATAGTTSPLLVIALIESAAGVLSLLNSSYLPERVLRLAFGAADYHGDLGTSPTENNSHLGLAHSALVLASAAAGLAPPLDSPHFFLSDELGLLESAQLARQSGFGGKLAIHPKQLPGIKESFRSSSNELSWAHEVLSAWDSPLREGDGALLIGGQLVDEAMVRRARSISSQINQEEK